jgi:hypothetical protein
LPLFIQNIEKSAASKPASAIIFKDVKTSNLSAILEVVVETFIKSRFQNKY